MYDLRCWYYINLHAKTGVDFTEFHVMNLLKFHMFHGGISVFFCAEIQSFSLVYSVIYSYASQKINFSYYILLHLIPLILGKKGISENKMNFFFGWCFIYWKSWPLDSTVHPVYRFCTNLQLMSTLPWILTGYCKDSSHSSLENRLCSCWHLSLSLNLPSQHVSPFLCAPSMHSSTI